MFQSVVGFLSESLPKGVHTVCCILYGTLNGMAFIYSNKNNFQIKLTSVLFILFPIKIFLPIMALVFVTSVLEEINLR